MDWGLLHTTTLMRSVVATVGSASACSFGRSFSSMFVVLECDGQKYSSTPRAASANPTLPSAMYVSITSSRFNRPLS
ncbi:unnamed protein product, partial [Musa textilis]